MARTPARIIATPAASLKSPDINAVYLRLRNQADQRNAAYPQYRNYWDTWKPVQVRRDFKTKAGLAFAAGDLVLCSPEVRIGELEERYAGKRFRTCYSFRTGWNTSIREDFLDLNPACFQGGK